MILVKHPGGMEIPLNLSEGNGAWGAREGQKGLKMAPDLSPTCCVTQASP